MSQRSTRKKWILTYQKRMRKFAAFVARLARLLAVILLCYSEQA